MEGESTAKKTILQISPTYFPTVPQRQQAEHGKKLGEIKEDTPLGANLPVMFYSL